jgi:hypothetical protein
LGSTPTEADQPNGFSIRHPHTIGEWNANNTVYSGKGCVAKAAPTSLRLSVPGKPVSHWTVPPWLRVAGLTYHGRAERWISDTDLRVVGRGQEFVCDIADSADATAWCEKIKATIRGY